MCIELNKATKIPDKCAIVCLGKSYEKACFYKNTLNFTISKAPVIYKTT